MQGFSDWLQPSVASPPHQDKAQLKEVQGKTTKGCADLCGALNLWTSTKWRGGGMSHQGFFFFIYFQLWNLPCNGRREMQTWLAQQMKERRRGERVRPTTKHTACCVSCPGSWLRFQNRRGEKNVLLWFMDGNLGKTVFMLGFVTKAAGLMNHTLKVIIHSRATQNPRRPCSHYKRWWYFLGGTI